MKFSKAYEPNQFEPDIYALWESSDAFKPTTDPKADPYTIVMPPPNANGNLHIGHGLTTALQDILIRYHRLKGDNTWYIPGADHAGFETWVVYERHLEAEGKSRFDYTRDQLYRQVWDFVHHQRGNMELQLRSLGASCDWSALTFTLDKKVISQVYATFKQMWDDQLVYRDKKLVNFCTKHQTAFADIEVAHKEEQGTLWDIAYPLAEVSPQSGQSPKGSVPTTSITEIIISTTRPETLLGDTAVAVNPNDPRYKTIIGKNVKLPLTDREIPIIADDHADMTFGTGAVKITPAHDHNDNEVGHRHNLPAITVIGFDGKMTPAAGANYENLTVTEARTKVLEDLKALGLLRGQRQITHSVGHCYKCDTVIEPLLKEQWFVNIKPLADQAIAALQNNQIKFHPASKKKILINYLKNLKDWNISRQIPWGIPIPAFHDRAGNWIFDTHIDQSQLVKDGKAYTRDEDTFDTWFSSGQWPFITTNHLNDHGETSKSEVISTGAVVEEGSADPYFEPNAATAAREDGTARKVSAQVDITSDLLAPHYPLSVMETGSDLLFAWVGRMIMLGLYVTGDVPFKDVYMHGMVLDERGQKMSKSKGNVINPMEVISEYGSDAFRLGIVASRSAGVNQAFSTSKVIAGRNLSNKLWNISRFIQQLVDESEESTTTTNSTVEARESALGKPEATPTRAVVEEGSADPYFEPNAATAAREDGTARKVSALVGAASDLPELVNAGEDWILQQLTSCTKQLDKLLPKYRFAEATELLYDTIWNKYADWFLESQKLYKNIPLLKSTLEHILIMLHPFAPFVTETIWQTLSWTNGLLITQKWPHKLTYDPTAADEFQTLTTIISTVRGHVQALGTPTRPSLLFGNDQLVNDHQILIQFLSHAENVLPTSKPRGMRLALPGRDIYLDIDEQTLKNYKQTISDNIKKLQKEIDTLKARLKNPNYTKKAPKALVTQTKDQLAEKQTALARLKQELTLI